MKRTKYLADLSPGDICASQSDLTCPMVVVDKTTAVGLGGTYSIGVYAYLIQPLVVIQDQLTDQLAEEAFEAIMAGRIDSASSPKALKLLATVSSV